MAYKLSMRDLCPLINHQDLGGSVFYNAGCLVGCDKPVEIIHSQGSSDLDNA